MSTQFITNQDRLLSDKEIKILVGLEVEKDISNKIKEFEVINDVNASRGKIRDNYYRSFVELYNDTDYFDSAIKREAFKIFVKKIEDGTLEIKKTLRPNHAKLYIFENKKEHNQNGEFPGTVITGSSNLSRAGLKGRFEINVISRETQNYKEAYKIFSTLWQDAITIVDKSAIKDFFFNVVEKIWFEKLPKPFLLYVRVLEEYFAERKGDAIRLPREITRNKYINLKYQEDAINRALDIISRHNGVIIADVVGLGKSIIASAIAHNLNMKTVIITSPHLRFQWEEYHNEFEFHARIYSSGKIKEALREIESDEKKLIIIDEAHKYRNELTEDYGNLHKLCQKNKVMLLTATPFNNRPLDIFSMVSLFQLRAKSTIQTVDSLSFQFKRLIIAYKKIKESQDDK